MVVTHPGMPPAAEHASAQVVSKDVETHRSSRLKVRRQGRFFISKTALTVDVRSWAVVSAPSRLIEDDADLVGR